MQMSYQLRVRLLREELSMKLASLVTACLALFLAVDTAPAVPPDQIRNSPIPPLKAPERPANWRRAVQQQTPPAPEAGSPIPGTAPAAPAGVRLAQPSLPNGAAEVSEVAPGNYPEEDDVDYDAQRAEIWSSPEMREAREFVMEYARRSAQSSESEGRMFLGRLSQLSPEGMRSWLERYQQQRMRLSTGRAVQENARQLSLEHAIDRQDRRRQAFSNINQYQSVAAERAGANIQSRNEMSQELRNARSYRRDMTVLIDRQQDFDPFYPTFDPMTPPRNVAAAVTLPGDLPRGDPRNRVVDVVDVGPNGGGTVILEGGGAVPNTGGPAVDGSGGTGAGGGGGTDSQ
jgi:hypothetical protein